jgi:hypothetical protein
MHMYRHLKNQYTSASMRLRGNNEVVLLILTLACMRAMGQKKLPAIRGQAGHAEAYMLINLENLRECHGTDERHV